MNNIFIAHSVDYAVARYLSGCLSHAGIFSKRLNILSNFFAVGQPDHSRFLIPNVMPIFHQGSANKGVECKGGMRFTTLDQYRALSLN